MFAVSPNSQPQTSATPREFSLLLGNISESFVRRVLKDDFGLKPIRRINAHYLTAAQKTNRVVRCREAGRRSDEADFTHVAGYRCIAASRRRTWPS
jgi:hypothetical protein